MVVMCTSVTRCFRSLFVEVTEGNKSKHSDVL